MLKLSKNLQNLKVVSLRTGGPIALALNPIINPHNLKIIGWWCRLPATPKLRVLLSNDTRDFKANSITINDEEDIVDPTDLARHQDILEINYDLIGKVVKTKRNKIGKVTDFSFNDGMFVQKLYVEKPMHKVFSAEDLVLIDRTQILEVTDHYILVKDSDIKVKQHDLAAAPEPA